MFSKRKARRVRAAPVRQLAISDAFPWRAGSQERVDELSPSVRPEAPRGVRQGDSEQQSGTLMRDHVCHRPQRAETWALVDATPPARPILPTPADQQNLTPPSHHNAAHIKQPHAVCQEEHPSSPPPPPG